MACFGGVLEYVRGVNMLKPNNEDWLDHIDDDLHREMLRVEAIELGLLPDDDTKITSIEDLRTRWG
jgi:hypothetical protein